MVELCMLFWFIKTQACAVELLYLKIFDLFGISGFALQSTCSQCVVKGTLQNHCSQILQTVRRWSNSTKPPFFEWKNLNFLCGQFCGCANKFTFIWHPKTQFAPFLVFCKIFCHQTCLALFVRSQVRPKSCRVCNSKIYFEWSGVARLRLNHMWAFFSSQFVVREMIFL